MALASPAPPALKPTHILSTADWVRHVGYATILKTLGVEYMKETITPVGRRMSFSSGQPIEKLLG